MRTVYNYLKKPFLSFLAVAALEAFLMLIAGDTENCFFHNTISGNILLWMARLGFFMFFLIWITYLTLPRYKSLKDRLEEKQEQENAMIKERERAWQQKSKSWAGNLHVALFFCSALF